MDAGQHPPESRRFLAFHKGHQMFISNIHGKEAINAKAVQIGCTAGEALQGRSGYGAPALTGNTFGIKDQLKAAGARWDSLNKAWAFANWASLEAALDNIIGA